MNTFRELMDFYSRRLGEHQLPLDWSARCPDRLVSCDAIHRDLAKKIVCDLFRNNGCQWEGSPVTLEATLDSIGRTRRELLDSKTADVLSVTLVDRLGELAVEWFDTARAVQDRTAEVANDNLRESLPD